MQGRGRRYVVQELQLHALVEQLLFLMWWPKKRSCTLRKKSWRRTWCNATKYYIGPASGQGPRADKPFRADSRPGGKAIAVRGVEMTPHRVTFS